MLVNLLHQKSMTNHIAHWKKKWKKAVSYGDMRHIRNIGYVWYIFLKYCTWTALNIALFSLCHMRPFNLLAHTAYKVTAILVEGEIVLAYSEVLYSLFSDITQYKSTAATSSSCSNIRGGYDVRNDHNVRSSLLQWTPARLTAAYSTLKICWHHREKKIHTASSLICQIGNESYVRKILSCWPSYSWVDAVPNFQPAAAAVLVLAETFGVMYSVRSRTSVS